MLTIWAILNNISVYVKTANATFWQILENFMLLIVPTSCHSAFMYLSVNTKCFVELAPVSVCAFGIFLLVFFLETKF